MSFSSLGLSVALLKVINEQNYKSTYPIQKEVIPAILKGDDVLGIAKTGSGKTASFVLPILELLQRQILPTKNRHVKVLVMVPTRELADQVHSTFVLLGQYLPDKFKSLAIYGGVSINPQMIALQGVDILVATPGRLLELVDSNAVSLSSVQVLVLDEADKMLNLGFKEEMTSVLGMLPAKRQTLLFSATLSSDLSFFQENLLRAPRVIKVEEAQDFNLDLIKQTVYLVSQKKKGPLLRYLIKKNDLQQVLVFTSSVHRADAVAVKLNSNGISAMAIHSKQSQGKRTSALRQFKSGQLRVLVATDLMARGIDIKSLPCVINYELPRSPKDYIHRIGRTGRAETPGWAVAIVSQEEEHHFKVIQKKMGRIASRVDGNDLNLQGF